MHSYTDPWMKLEHTFNDGTIGHTRVAILYFTQWSLTHAPLTPVKIGLKIVTPYKIRIIQSQVDNTVSKWT